MTIEEAKQISTHWLLTAFEDPVTPPNKRVEQAMQMVWKMPANEADDKCKAILSIWNIILSYVVEYQYGTLLPDREVRLDRIMLKTKAAVEQFKGIYGRRSDQPSEPIVFHAHSGHCTNCGQVVKMRRSDQGKLLPENCWCLLCGQRYHVEGVTDLAAFDREQWNQKLGEG